MVGALGLVVAGRVLGATELYLLGAGLVALVGVALVWVNVVGVRLGVTRSVNPGRLHQTGPGLVELTFVNAGARRSATMRLRDEVSGTRGATMRIGPLIPGEQAGAAYQLPTARRGRMTVGPLEAELADPFGLCARRVAVAEEIELVVYPLIDRLLPVAHAAGYDPRAATRNSNAQAASGEDFFALRPYAVGDDLRRVHWPTMARTGELVIRQHEQPWQERTTVLLEVDTDRMTEVVFDRVVAAAASLLAASCEAGDQIRLCTSAGTDSGFGAGPGHLDALLLRLALNHPEPDAPLRTALDRLARGESGGSLVVLAAAIGTAESVRLAPLRGRFGQVVVVSFDTERDRDTDGERFTDGNQDGSRRAPAQTVVHEVPGDAPHATGEAMGARRSSAAGLLHCPDGARFATVWNGSDAASTAQRRAGARR